MACVVDSFIQNPSETLLEQCTKEQLLKIAEHYNIAIESNGLKQTMKSILQTNLVKDGNG